ncbi:MAG: hypothetical protein ACE5KT_09430 [Methanosarcinales archaeon]
MSIIGVASAGTELTLNPSTISMAPGDNESVNVTVSNTGDTGLTYSLTVTNFRNTQNGVDEQSITTSLASSLYVPAHNQINTSLTIYTTTSTPISTYAYSVFAYNFTFNEGFQVDGDVGILNVIPEFATIAMPIALTILIGIFFRIRRKL